MLGSRTYYIGMETHRKALIGYRFWHIGRGDLEPMTTAARSAYAEPIDVRWKPGINKAFCHR